MLPGCAQDGSVPCYRVEVDHAVERATAANPLVDGLALLLLVRVVVPLDRRAMVDRRFIMVLQSWATGTLNPNSEIWRTTPQIRNLELKGVRIISDTPVL